VVTAFQPLCQIPREPSMEKNWVWRADPAFASSKLYRMLTPSNGAWL
jgi:hypothetical protein